MKNIVLSALTVAVIMSGTGQAYGFHLKNTNSGLCIDVAQGSKENGTNIIQYQCETVREQSWTKQPAGIGVNLVAAHSRKCLDVAHASREDSANVVQWKCTNGAAEQIWIFKQRGAGYEIVNANSNKCLEVHKGSKASKASITQYKCTGTADQIWQIIENQF